MFEAHPIKMKILGVLQVVSVALWITCVKGSLVDLHELQDDADLYRLYRRPGVRYTNYALHPSSKLRLGTPIGPLPYAVAAVNDHFLQYNPIPVDSAHTDETLKPAIADFYTEPLDKRYAFQTHHVETREAHKDGHNHDDHNHNHDHDHDHSEDSTGSDNFGDSHESHHYPGDGHKHDHSHASHHADKGGN